MMARIVLFVLLIGIIGISYAEIYKTVDPAGNVTYSDEPTKGAQKVNVKPLQEISMPAPTITPPVLETTPKDLARANASVAYEIGIIAPQEKETFQNTRQVTVIASVKPDLQNMHQVQALLDGKIVDYPMSSRFNLTGIERGEHQLQIQVVDHQGKSLGISKAVTFYVHQRGIGTIRSLGPTQ